jgi:hypothetical protein
MFRKFTSRRPSHTTIVAYLALFLALGGSAVATHSHLTRTRDLADNAVTTRKIAPNAITPSRVLDNSLTGGDLRLNSVGGPRILDGSLQKQDFKAGELPQGAVQWNFFTPSGLGGSRYAPYGEDSSEPGRYVNGLRWHLTCNPGSTYLRVSVWAADPDDEVQVTGFEAADDVVKPVHRSGDWGHNFEGITTHDLQVLARNVRVGKWTHFAVGAYNAGYADGCNFWGLVTPPSN